MMLESPCIPAVTTRAPQALSGVAPVSPTSRVFHWGSSNSSSGLLYPSSSKSRSFSMLQVVPGSRSTASVQSCSSSSKASSVTEELSSCILPHIAPLDKKGAPNKDVDGPHSQESPWSLLGTTPAYDEFFEWAVKDTSQGALSGVSFREPSQTVAPNVPYDSGTRRLISSSPSNDKNIKKRLSTQLLKVASQECHNRVSFCFSQPLKCEENGSTGQSFGRHSGEGSIDGRNIIESQSSSERSAVSFVAHENKTNSLSPMPVETRKLKPMKLQFFRTKMCPWVVSIGHCRKGSSCRYAHTLGELRPLPDLSKTKLCPKLIETGSCERYKDCKYAHSQDELRATQSFSKTKLCPLWLEGQCLAGNLCRFAHGEKELRPIVDATRKGTVKDAGGTVGDAVARCSSRKGCDTNETQNTDLILGDRDALSLLDNSMGTDENETLSIMGNLCSSHATRANSDIWRERSDKAPKLLAEAQCNSFNNGGRTRLSSELKSPCFGAVKGGITRPACGQASSAKDAIAKTQEKETSEISQLFKKGHRELVGRDDLTTTSTSAESHANFSLETGLPFEESANTSFENGNVFETQTTLDGPYMARDLAYQEYAMGSDVAYTGRSAFSRNEEEKNSLRRSSLASWPLRLRRFSCQERHSVCTSASAAARYHSLTKSLFPLNTKPQDKSCQQGTVSIERETANLRQDGKKPTALYSASQSWSPSSAKSFAALPYLNLSSQGELEGRDKRYNQSTVLPSVEISLPTCEIIPPSSDVYLGGPSRSSPAQTRPLLSDEFDLPFSSSGPHCVPTPTMIYGNGLRNEANLQEAPFGWVSPEPVSQSVGLDFKSKQRRPCDSPDLSSYTPYWTQEMGTATQWDQETGSREQDVRRGVNPSTTSGFMAPTHFLPPGMFSPVPQRTMSTLPPRAPSVLHMSFPNAAAKRDHSFRCQGLDSTGSKKDSYPPKVATENVCELSSSPPVDKDTDSKTTLVGERCSRFEDVNSAKEKSPLSLQLHYGSNITCKQQQQKNQFFLITSDGVGAQRKPAEPMDSLSPLVHQTTSDANLSRRYTIPFETVSAHESGFLLGHNGPSLSCGGRLPHSTPATQCSAYAYKPPLVTAKQRTSAPSVLRTDKTQTTEVLNACSQVMGSASGGGDLHILRRHAPKEPWELVTPAGLGSGPAANKWLRQKSQLLDVSCLDFHTGATGGEPITKPAVTNNSTREVLVERPGLNRATSLCSSLQNRNASQVMQPMCVASPLKSSVAGYASTTKSPGAMVSLDPSIQSHSNNGDSMFPEFPFFSSFKAIGSSSDATTAFSDVDYCTSLAVTRSFTAPMQQFRAQKLSGPVDHQEVGAAVKNTIASDATKAINGGFARSRTVDVSGTAAAPAQTSP